MQRKPASAGARAEERTHQLAAEGTRGAAGPIPHGDAIKASFGAAAPVVDSIQAHVGGPATAASEDMGAEAYATGDHVAFASTPSLHTAAHEAAHIVQQRGGVQLKGGVGEAGDPYEQHADAVADRVVAGQSAESLFGLSAAATESAGDGGVSNVVQLKPAHNPHEHTDPNDLYPDLEDEAPANWNEQVREQMPGDPYVPFEIVPAPQCPLPPDVRTEPHRGSDPDAIATVDHRQTVSPQKLAQRQAAWNAYVEMSRGVDEVQRDVAADVNLFQHAETNSELAALGFTMKKGYHGDQMALTEAQQVPKQGGPRVGSLFASGDGALKVTTADRASIGGAADATRRGKGGAEAGFLGADQADAKLKAAVLEVQVASTTLVGKNDALNAAGLAIKAFDANNEAEAAREEIEKIKAESSSSAIGGIVSFVAKIPAGLDPFLSMTGKQALQVLGTIGSGILQAIPDDRLAAAKDRLLVAEHNFKTGKARELQARVDTAKADVAAAVDELAAKRELVRAAVIERRMAYDAAGEAVGAAATGGDESKQKVAGIIAAIPLAESVVAAAKNIYERTRTGQVIPAYNDDIGMAYGIALYHQTEAAWLLPTAIGTLVGIKWHFQDAMTLWQERLDSLHAVKVQIGGIRPGQED